MISPPNRRWYNVAGPWAVAGIVALAMQVASAQPAATPAPQAEAEPPRAEEEIVEATADERRPLEDYEASEQISEDLSVSFPVDI